MSSTLIAYMKEAQVVTTVWIDIEQPQFKNLLLNKEEICSVIGIEFSAAFWILKLSSSFLFFKKSWKCIRKIQRKNRFTWICWNAFSFAHWKHATTLLQDEKTFRLQIWCWKSVCLICIYRCLRSDFFSFERRNLSHSSMVSTNYKFPSKCPRIVQKLENCRYDNVCVHSHASSHWKLWLRCAFLLFNFHSPTHLPQSCVVNVL